MKQFTDISTFYKYISTKDNLNLNIDKLEEDYRYLYYFVKFYKKIKIIMSKEIKKYNHKFLNKNDNSIVTDLINKFIDLNSDGKYIRATLIALGYYNNTSKLDNYFIPLAASYETFQTSILIHDDIIDKSDKRRGKDTIPYRYNQNFSHYPNQDKDFSNVSKDTSNSLGICAGDLGFYLSSSMIYENYHKDSNFSKLLECYNQIVVSTIKGEILDVYLPFNSKYKNCLTKEDEVFEIYKLKTSYYTILGPFKLGTILAKNNLSNKLEKALENMGIAFQIKDDILGIYGSIENIGKSNSSDICEFKQTILYTYTINNDKYRKELLKYYGKNNITPDDLNLVRKIFTNSGAYDYAITKSEELFKESISLIKSDKSLSNNIKEILLGLIIYLRIREK